MRVLRRVGVAVSPEFPQLDADWPDLHAALGAAGLDPVLVAWDQESVGGAMATIARRLGETAYARVDVIDGNDGAPVILEVELVEPSLFLPAAEGAAARFVMVLADLLGL